MAVPVQVVYVLVCVCVCVCAFAVGMWARTAPNSFIRAMECLRLVRVTTVDEQQALVGSPAV